LPALERFLPLGAQALNGVSLAELARGGGEDRCVFLVAGGLVAAPLGALVEPDQLGAGCLIGCGVSPLRGLLGVALRSFDSLFDRHRFPWWSVRLSGLVNRHSPQAAPIKKAR
jgi:hypothetical protein